MEWCQEQHIEKPVTSSYYLQVLKDHYNYGFGSPKSDTCGRCELEEKGEHKEKADSLRSTEKR